MKRRIVRRPSQQKGVLDTQIEMVRPSGEAQRIDSVDPDLDSYVLPYLEKLFTEIKAPQIDLTSQDAAKDSLKTIELTLNELNSALHRTRSLRMQLEQKRGPTGRR